MIEIITREVDDTLAIRMSGKITGDDYDLIIPLLEEKIRKFERVNMYCEIEDVEGVDPAAFWRDLKFDLQHLNDFERVAMVGNKKWIEWMTNFAKPFTSAKIKFFDNDEKKNAMTWVAERSASTHV